MPDRRQAVEFALVSTAALGPVKGEIRSLKNRAVGCFLREQRAAKRGGDPDYVALIIGLVVFQCGADALGGVDRAGRASAEKIDREFLAADAGDVIAFEDVAGDRVHAKGRTSARKTAPDEKVGSSSTTGIGSSTATTEPTLGMKLSQKAMTPKTSQRSRPTASRMSAVATPTPSEMSTLPLM